MSSRKSLTNSWETERQREADLGDHREGVVEGDAGGDHALGRVEQRGERRLEAVLVDRDQGAGVDRALQARRRSRCRSARRARPG